MKHACLKIAALLGSTAVCAAEVPPAPGAPAQVSVDAADAFRANALGNLHFYVPAQRFLVTLGTNFDLSSHSYQSQNGQADDVTTRSINNFSLDAIYGLIDRLRFEIQENYLARATNEYAFVNSNSTSFTTSSGFSDPTFGLAYRVLERPSSGWFGDVGVAFSPSISGERGASAAQAGNDHRGYSTVDLNTTWIWSGGAGEWGGTAGATYLGSGSTNNASSASDSTFDHRWTYYLRAKYRVHATESFFIEPILTFNFPTTSQYNFPDSSSESYKDPFRIEPQLAAGYLVRPNLMLQAYLNYVTYTGSATFTNSQVNYTDCNGTWSFQGTAQFLF